MPNALTGEYDAVVQMSVPRINRLLALLHQEEVFSHSFTLSVDTVILSANPVPTPRAAQAGLAVLTVTEAGPIYAEHVNFTAYSEVSRHAGVLRVSHAGVTEAFKSFRAQVDVQASTPTVTIPPDPEGRKATVHFQVMAHVSLQPGSVHLPEFMHGEVQLTLDAVQIRWQGVGPHAAQTLVLDFDIANADMEVRFVPAPNTVKGTKAYRDAVVAVTEEVIASVMRDGFQSANRVIDVPPDVRHLELKTIGGAAPTVALLLNLPPPPNQPAHGLSAGARAGVVDSFVDAADDFAIAVGREFVVGTVQALVDKERKKWVMSKTGDQSEDTYVEPIKVEVAGREVTIDYIVTFTGRTVELEDGAIRLTMTAHGHHDTRWIIGCLNYDIDFEVTQRLRLVVENGMVRLEFIEPLEVTGFEGKVRPICTDLDPKQMLTDQIGAIARPVLKPANATLATLLSSIDFGRMLKGLQLSTVSSSFRAAEVRPEAIVLHGTLALPAWKNANLVNDGFTVLRDGAQKLLQQAHLSWIPGGTVTSYRFYGRGRSVLEDHRFMTFLDPAGGPAPACLELVGTQTTDTGETRTIRRQRCRIVVHLFGLVPDVDVPNVPRAIAIPRPGDPVPDAYIDPWAAGLTAPVTGTSTVVHFPGDDAAPTLRVLQQVLGALPPLSAVSAIVVMPRAGRARPIEGAERDRQTGREARASVSYTEDIGQGWSRTFDVRRRPTTLLVGRMGNVQWRRDGELNAEALSAAIREHPSAPRRPEYHPLALKVREGDRAPDFVFEFLPGRRMPLHTLRGRPIDLVFWTSWAEPSLLELRLLDRRRDDPSRDRTLVLAINDGEAVTDAREVFEQHGFAATFVPDPERQISRLYGVHCWPTTISLDERGRVWDFQMGRSPDEPQGEPEREASAANAT